MSAIMVISLRERVESLKQLQSTLGPGVSADLSIEFLSELPTEERTAALIELLDLMHADLAAQNNIPVEEIREAFLDWVPTKYGGRGAKE